MSVSLNCDYKKLYVYCSFYLISFFMLFFVVELREKAFEVPSFIYIFLVGIVFLGSVFFTAIIKEFSNTIITERALIGTFKQKCIFWQDISKMQSIFFLPVHFIFSENQHLPLLIPKSFFLKNPKTTKEALKIILYENPEIVSNQKVKNLFDKFGCDLL